MQMINTGIGGRPKGGDYSREGSLESTGNCSDLKCGSILF